MKAADEMTGVAEEHQLSRQYFAGGLNIVTDQDMKRVMLLIAFPWMPWTRHQSICSIVCLCSALLISSGSNHRAEDIIMNICAPSASQQTGRLFRCSFN